MARTDVHVSVISAEANVMHLLSILLIVLSIRSSEAVTCYNCTYTNNTQLNSLPLTCTDSYYPTGSPTCWGDFCLLSMSEIENENGKARRTQIGSIHVW